MNPLSRFRAWWHQPVLDALARIEQQGVKPPITTKRIGDAVVVGVDPTDLARNITWEVKSAKRGGTYC